MLEKSGYEKDAAGGLLAAGGLGAILSPPVLGAAAFIIAEIPEDLVSRGHQDGDDPDRCSTTSRSSSMVELDARKYGMSEGRVRSRRKRVDARQALLVPLLLAHPRSSSSC